MINNIKIFKTKLLISFFGMLLTFTGIGAEIQLVSDASLVERTAAGELQEYITKMTGKKPEITKKRTPMSFPVFSIRIDKKIKQDEWNIKSMKNGVQLRGGKGAGILYAVYHYLEDICGVRWWNPCEETVPKFTKLPVDKLKLKGKPAFDIREIFSLYGNDNGRFASRCKFNGDPRSGYGNPVAGIAAKYGGKKIFGSPDFCHTYGRYIPPEKYFKKHPEWFSLIEGKRFAGKGTGADSSQLCLSNKVLRKEMLKQVLKCIEKSQTEAIKAGLEPPLIYDVSQNDSMRFCQCKNCQKIVAEKGAAQSGLMLDFVNEIADKVKKKYPAVLLTAYAYHHTEKPPKNIKPRSNVIIVLCDTQSNAAQALTMQANPYFCKLLKSWRKIAPRLRIWDYAVTFWKPAGLPYASEDTYANDLRLFKRSNAKQLFTELPLPIAADARDYKVWLRAKLTENPNADWKKLSKCFTDGFYGKAGVLFRKYRRLLRQSQQKKQTFFGMGGPVDAFTHLDLKTVIKAQKIFDQGEKLLSGNDVLMKRWRHARLGLDRATLARRRSLMQEYLKKNGSINGYPFEDSPIIDRIRKTWTEQAKMRLNPKTYAQSMSDLNKELKVYS